ncbi:unnamed protein product [Cunninghamella echinulata]
MFNKRVTAVYDNDHLLLAFGFTGPTTPVTSLNVLNITISLQPSWVTALAQSNQNYELYHGLNKASLITIIVVVAVIVLIRKKQTYKRDTIGILFYIRHKIRQKKKQFAILQPDENVHDHHHQNINKIEPLGLSHDNTQQYIKPYDKQLRLKDFNDNNSTIIGITATSNTHRRARHKPFGEE